MISCYIVVKSQGQMFDVQFPTRGVAYEILLDYSMENFTKTSLGLRR